MFDEVELLGELPPARWPLHPAPLLFERLEAYIRRLAWTYDMGVGTFCQYGLGCTLHDLDGCGADPPLAMLFRLSRGTGLPVQRFRDLTDRRFAARMSVAVRWMGRRDPESVHKWYQKFSRHREFVDSIYGQECT